MIHKSDIQWWVLEARKHPEAAPAIIEQLAERLVQLDADNERLREDLLEAQRHTSPEQGEELSDLRRQVQMLRELAERQASLEPSLVLFSTKGQITQLSLARAAEIAHGAAPPLSRRALSSLSGLLLARPHDRILLITNEGRILPLAAIQVPPLPEDGGWPSVEPVAAPDGSRMGADEWLTAATVVADPPRFWSAVTRRGWVRQYLGQALERDMAKAGRLIESPIPRDVPVALVSGDAPEILIVTRWGRAARFAQRVIAAQGEVALEVDPDDEVVAAMPLAADAELVLVTAGGALMRRPTAQVPTRARPGGAGRQLIQAFDVLAALPYDPGAHLLFLTHSGRLVATACDTIPLHERVGKGTPLVDLARDPATAVALTRYLPGS